MSIADDFAELMVKKAECMTAIAALHDKDLNQIDTFLSIATNEAISGVTAAIRSAWSVIDRLQTVAEKANAIAPREPQP